MKVSDSITRLEALLLIPPPADGTEPDGQMNVRIQVTEDDYEERYGTAFLFSPEHSHVLIGLALVEQNIWPVLLLNTSSFSTTRTRRERRTAPS